MNGYIIDLEQRDVYVAKFVLKEIALLRHAYHKHNAALKDCEARLSAHAQLSGGAGDDAGDGDDAGAGDDSGDGDDAVRKDFDLVLRAEKEKHSSQLENIYRVAREKGLSLHDSKMHNPLSYVHPQHLTGLLPAMSNVPAVFSVSFPRNTVPRMLHFIAAAESVGRPKGTVEIGLRAYFAERLELQNDFPEDHGDRYFAELTDAYVVRSQLQSSGVAAANSFSEDGASFSQGDPIDDNTNDASDGDDVQELRARVAKMVAESPSRKLVMQAIARAATPIDLLKNALLVGLSGIYSGVLLKAMLSLESSTTPHRKRKCEEGRRLIPVLRQSCANHPNVSLVILSLPPPPLTVSLRRCLVHLCRQGWANNPNVSHLRAQRVANLIIRAVNAFTLPLYIINTRILKLM